jgi:prophage antirepressor-like protein
MLQVKSNSQKVFPFSYNGSQLNVIQIDGEPWFIAKEVCDYFLVSNRNRVLQNVDSEDKGGTQIETPGGKQTVTIINESGLYSVLFNLKPQMARGISEEEFNTKDQLVKSFKRWVTHEVLPSIRKHGGYLTPTKTEELLANPDLIIEMATNLKMERAKANQLMQMVDERNEIIDLQGQQLMKQAPAIEYYTKVLNAEDTVSTNIIAKELGMSAVTLNKLLHEEYGIIYKQGDVWLPYARYQAMDLHRTKTYTYVSSDGSIKTRISMVWTQKGRALIHELLKKRK